MKSALGIEVLVRGRNHLDDVRRQLEQELEKIGDPETKSLVQKKIALEKEKASVTDRLKELDSNAEAEKARQKEIDQRLRTLEDARAMQQLCVVKPIRTAEPVFEERLPAGYAFCFRVDSPAYVVPVSSV